MIFTKLLQTDAPIISTGYPNIVRKSSTNGSLLTYSIYGNSKQSILPDGYTQLEYLQSEGTNSIIPYIDTLFVPTINSKARVKFCPVTTNSRGFFGSRSDDTSARFCGATFSSGTYFAFSMNNLSWSANRTAVTIGNVYDCTAYNGKQIINGTEYTESTITELNATSTFKLAPVVANGTAGTAGEGFNIKYYLCQLWENDILVHDFIPAKRNSDNVLGMYDLITNTFFTNAGTGVFTAGPVAPTPSAPIEVTSVGDKVTQLWNPANKLNAYVQPVITTNPIVEDAQCAMYWFPVEAGKTYTVHSSICNRFRLGFTTVQPAVGVSATTVYIDDTYSEHNHTFTNTDNYNYCYAQVTNVGVEPDIFYANEGSIINGYKIPVINGANCGVVNLGTLSWIWRRDISRFESVLSNKAVGTQNIFTSTLITGDNYSSLVDKSCCGSASYNKIFIRYDEFGTDVNALKAAMSGKYLYYQRTTDASWTIPTTTNIYLSEPIRKVGTYVDSVFYGEGKNLFDNTTNNKWITVSGEITEATGCCARKFICNADDVFVLKAKYSTATANNIICVCAYDANGNKLTRTVKTDFVEDSIRFICPSSTAYIYAGRSTAVPSDIMLIKGSTIPAAYEPYSKTPKINRLVGVKVFDGTENVSVTSDYWQVANIISADITDRTQSVCTHYKYGSASSSGEFIVLSSGTGLRFNLSSMTTAEEVKTWLAAQYAAGTPVIVLYPLATQTTETTPDLPGLPVFKGTNTYIVDTEVKPDYSKNIFQKSLFANDTPDNLVYTAFQVPNGTYTMSSPDYPLGSGSITNVFFLAGNVSSGASSSGNGVAINKPITITVTDGYYTICHRGGTGQNPLKPIDYNWQIEQGSTATTYEPYQAHTISAKAWQWRM